jgi:hypothetical protein
MNYQNIYTQLVLKRQSILTEGYVEKHHIIPRCMGGTDEPENIVRLTAREHFVAHQLLVKIYPENKNLILAVIRFSRQIKSGLIVNSKLYQWLRIQCAKRASELMKGRVFSEEHRKKLSMAHSKPYIEKYSFAVTKSLKEKRVQQTTGDGNPMYGKIHTDETKSKMSEVQLEIYKQRLDESGSYITEEHRIKLSEATKGENNGMYGKTHSEMTKEKMSLKAKERPPFSDETKEKMRISSTGRIQSEETKRKKSEKLKGRVSPTKGKKVSPETIAKRIATRKLNKIEKELSNDK